MTEASPAVIVCAFTTERWDDLVAAVSSVLRQPGVGRVIVVIDHNDELLAQARREFTDCLVLANAGRQGLSDARNTALAEVTSEVVAFLDDDAVAAERWLEALTGHFDDPDVLAVGGRAIPVFDSATSTAMLPQELWWVIGCTFTSQPTTLAEVRNVMGCNMAFRTTALKAVGGFDSDMGRVGSIPLGCEETAACIRLRQHVPGGRILFDPAALVTHRVRPERGSLRYVVRRSFAEGLSKAVLTQRLGRRDALSAESSYALSVIPRGVARHVRQGNKSGFSGALAMLLSLVMAAAGMGAGTVRGLWVKARP